MEHLFTSESVSEGHPDKICDQISDAILDEIIANEHNPYLARGAIECLATTQHLTLAGEVRTVNPKTDLNYNEIVRRVLSDIGYVNPEFNFDSKNCNICNKIHAQSENIGDMVDDGGAGDQGLMFGYAVDETKELMPIPILIAHRLIERVDQSRKNKVIEYLRPDGKCQITVRYINGKPTNIEKVVIAVPYDINSVEKSKLTDELWQIVVEPLIESSGFEIKLQLKEPNPNFIVNGKGEWEIGGPDTDTGLTGRKVIVDTYGGMGRHGGGCFSGKDPTKVDRSASYMARYIAKNIIASGLAKKCEIQLAYVIGIKEPVSVMIETYGTGKISDEELVKIIRKVFDLTPEGIIDHLDLFRPIYRKTSYYGHFGRELENFTWEKTDYKERILRAII